MQGGRKYCFGCQTPRDFRKHHLYLDQARRKNGSIKSLPKAKGQRLNELEKRLKMVSTENDRLKRLLAEKELELAILRRTQG